MTRYPVAAGLVLAALLTAFVGGLRVGKHHSDTVMAQAQIQVKAHQEAEDAAHAQAGKLQQDANDADARAVDAGRRAQAAESNLAKYKFALPPDPGSDPAPVPTDVDLAPVVVEQRGLIGALKDQIGALTDEQKALRGANAALETALKQADIKADIQAQASKAALEGLRKAKWLDRLTVGGACLATGYGIGRIRR